MRSHAFAQVDDGGAAEYVLDGDLAEIVLVSDGTGVYEATDHQAHHADDGHHETAGHGAMSRRRAHRQRESVARANDAAAVALTAEQVGAAERILEVTVEYTKDRVQFGRPIGSFQALKHRMADLHVLAEAARSASCGRCRRRRSLPAVAKAYCSEAFLTIAGECIQLHGGIAITWEHDAHLYFKRAHSSAQLFGSPDEHVRRSWKESSGGPAGTVRPTRDRRPAHRYSYAIDFHQWDDLDEIFTADATLDFTATGGESGDLATMKQWLARTLDLFAGHQHLVATSQIELDGDRASGQTICHNPMYLDVDGKQQLLFVGLWYLDEFVRTPHGWRITSRSSRRATCTGCSSALRTTRRHRPARCVAC